MNKLPQPRRGEIWFARLPTDPPGKGPRPVAIVSIDQRNLNERADTVLVIPLTTTLRETPYRFALSPGETGLQEPSMLMADGISTIRKADLLASRAPLRRLSELRIRECAVRVVRSMGLTTDIAHIQ